jgi:hypothetical protein
MKGFLCCFIARLIAARIIVISFLLHPAGGYLNIALLTLEGSVILLENGLELGNILLELYFHRFPQQPLRDMKEVGCAGLREDMQPRPAADILENIGCPGMNRPA